MKTKLVKMFLLVVKAICLAMYRLAVLMWQFLALMFLLMGLGLCMSPEVTFLRMQDLNNSGQLFQLETVYLIWSILTLIQIPRFVHAFVGMFRLALINWKLRRIR